MTLKSTPSPHGDALVIIPTYNERENIDDVINLILQQPGNIDILVVDDNSPDKTADHIQRRQTQESRIHLLKRPGKMGLGSAYIEGFKFALRNGYHYIFEMDADLSHDPREIPRFLEAIQDADLVIGSRYIEGVNVVNWPLSRLLLSYFASVYVRFITGLPVRDATGGYKCFRRETLEAIDLDRIHSNGYSFQIEMNWNVWRRGLRIREIPITFVDRRVGQSKMSKAIVREAIWLVWKLFFAGLRRRPS
ncbi:MAG: polyprenol monophosphomannose synthase [Calditrichota bacterium]